MGLENSEHIQNIVIDPRNSNVVYVSAIGPLWSSGGDRGLFKTTDGGQTWKAVLSISADTGVTEVAMDPKNPDVLYAAAYQRRRAVGQLIGGGPESGLYKSTNARPDLDEADEGTADRRARAHRAGDQLAEPAHRLRARHLAARAGRVLPVGRCRGDVDADRTDGRRWPRRTWRRRPGGAAPAALRAGRSRTRRSRRATRRRRVAAAARSDDCYRGGDPGYYNEIYVDAHDPETIWSLQTNVDRSTDGGKTWSQVADARRARRSSRHRVRSDRQEPRHPRQRRRPLRDLRRHEDVAALHQPAAVAVLPGRHRQREAVLQRLRRRAGQRHHLRAVAHGQPRRHPHQRLVQRRRRRRLPAARRSRGSDDGLRAVAGRGAQPARSHERALGLHPSAAAEHERRRQAAGAGSRRRRRAADAAADSGRRASAAGTGTRRSSSARTTAAGSITAASGSTAATIAATRGSTVSPDLTRQLDATKIEIMGKVWPPYSVAFNQATTTLSTITAIDESPLLDGLLYVGTDDGLVQISEDGGRTWRKAEKFPGVAEYSYVTDVFASPRDANTVFATMNNYQRGDYKPYVVRSTDRGRTWTSIAGNLPGALRRVERRPGSRQRQPAVRRSRVRRVVHRRRRSELDAAEGRPADHSGARSAPSSGASTISSSERSAAAPSSSTTTRRCAS